MTHVPEGFPLPANLAKESLLCFFQAYFAQHGTYRYNPDDNQTKLFICDKYSYNREVAEQRPALVTDRGPIRWGRQFIDQHFSSSPSANKTFKDLLFATVTINAISREGLEAEELAQYAFLLPMIFKEMLRKQSGVVDILSTAIGRESILKSDSRVDLHVVPVEITVQMEIAWTIQDELAEVVGAVDIGIHDPKKLGDLPTAP